MPGAESAPDIPEVVGAASGALSSNRIATVPNLLSAIRIALIPAFVLLIADPDSRLGGMLLLGVVQSTDWVDGYLARRTGSVSELGKLLDPLADRLAVGAALITFVATEGLPLWTALTVLVRDGLVLAAAVYLFFAKGPRIDVRRIGKIATFTLMWGLPLIAWGNYGLPLEHLARICGWAFFGAGIIEYWVAAGLYVQDLRTAYAQRSGSRGQD
ncbi:MAG: CDP-alcohol phosphatidyltransferase family protein [Actinobacteria bacterium]|nr:CDP-alcohol phosphatidyltransferase family protein [Actinomycetota bacterium]